MPSRKTLSLLMLAGGIVAFAVLFFLRYKDPMILVFGVIAAAMAAFMMRVDTARWWGQIRVRCAKCGALNPEDARYCGQCREPM